MSDKQKPAEPVAWAQIHPEGHLTWVSIKQDELADWKIKAGWTHQPLYLKSPQPEREREVLESIRIYGSDTLSGRVDGPEDAEWYRGAVVEMTRRAFLGEPVAQREPEGMTYATRWDLLLADHHGELTVRRFDPKRNAIPVWIGTAPKPEREREAYHELIYAVESRYPNETRHQTALRYIQQAEHGSDEKCADTTAILGGPEE